MAFVLTAGPLAAASRRPQTHSSTACSTQLPPSPGRRFTAGSAPASQRPRPSRRLEWYAAPRCEQVQPSTPIPDASVPAPAPAPSTSTSAGTPAPAPAPAAFHHMSITTANVLRSALFYRALGFEFEERFRVDTARACWMTSPAGGRIELIQILQPRQASGDACGDFRFPSYYHMALDVTECAPSLPAFIEGLEARLAEAAAAPNALWAEPIAVRVIVPPGQQMINASVYETCFVADPDGLPVELLRLQTRLDFGGAKS
eukprot:tig00020629_g12421.t1